MTLFNGKKSGPEDWGINLDAHLTAVVVTEKRVQARFGYRSINETVVPEIETALKQALAAK